MSTFETIALLATVLIALLVLQAGVSWLGLQPSVPVANADSKQQPRLRRRR